MNLWNTPSRRLLCAERLESRRLLSAVAPDVGEMEDGDEEGAVAEEAEASPAGDALDSEESPDAPVAPLQAEEDDEGEVGTVGDEADDDDEVEGVLDDDEEEDEAEEAPVVGGNQAPAPTLPLEPPPTSVVGEPAPTSPVSEPAPEATPPLPEPTGRVRIIEEEVEEEEDDDVEVDLDDLPAAVRAAIESQFSGAALTEAEFGLGDEDEPEYGVAAQFSGQLIEVAVTPEGEIVETERLIDVDQLPQAVLDEVSRAYPGTEIEEAAVVTTAGEQKYEVLLSQPGQRDLEVKLGFVNTTPPRTDGEPEAPEQFIPIPPDGATAAGEDDRPAGETVAAGESAAARDEPSTEETGGTAAETEIARAERNDDDQSQDNRRRAEKDAEDIEAIDFTARAGTTLSAPVAEALQNAIVRGEAPVEWVPQIAGALSNVLPVDPSAVEHGMRRVLEGIDALSTRVTGDTAAGRGMVRVTIVAALLIGAKLLLLESRKNKGGPTVIFNSADSTWSWVIGRTPTSGRRRTSSRYERP